MFLVFSKLLQACKEAFFIFRRKKGLFKKTQGQAMVEYVLVVMAVLVGVGAANVLFIPVLQKYYELMALVIALPFP